MDAQRLAYLDRLGIPLWVPRATSEETPESNRSSDADVPLTLGPGEGAQLWLCDGDGVPSTRLAADLARCLPEPPVWAWPADQPGSMSLDEAVDARLFTAVVVLGEPPAGIGEAVGSARVLSLPTLAELQRHPSARRTAWQSLAAQGLVKGR